jgi:glycosyltransferase involved in cell wall biosynthesis/peptidoglycan/xylan/chitin deacetylase (PgdA/CDA1 family)
MTVVIERPIDETFHFEPDVDANPQLPPANRGRVAIVRHGSYPEQPHLRRDVDTLRRAGYQVDIICDSQPGKRHFERFNGITVIRVPLHHRRGGMPRYLFEYLAMPFLSAGALAARSLQQRYDFVEIDTMPDWLVVAGVVPKLLGSRLILYMFENMAELLAIDHQWSRSHPLVKALDAIERRCAGIADVVLTPYEKARDRLIERGLSPAKIKFIPNGPDEDVFLANADLTTIDAKLALPSTGFRMVTHGSLLQRYGIETLIESMALLRDELPALSLTVIGTGEYEPELRRRVDELGLSDGVDFIGGIPFEHVAAKLLEADLGVVPYWVDGMPNKLMEYLLLGIPAIVGDWPTMRLYFDDDCVRYVAPRDAQALAGDIRELFENRGLMLNLARTGHRRYMDTLAWRIGKLDYLAIYDEAPSEASQASSKQHGWLRFVLGQSRGPRNALRRIPTIVARFGITSRRSRRHLETLLRITKKYEVRPTLPITARVAERNPGLVRWLHSQGVEIAAHGYVHNDFAVLSSEEQKAQALKSRERLERIVPGVRGWRCPYSRWNEKTPGAVRGSGFAYDATPVSEWPAFAHEGIRMSSCQTADYARICRLFQVRDASRCAVLPYTEDGLVRIPMSIPQDEDMVDRLHLTSEEMTRVWMRVLAESSEFGEMFVICLHPERANICSAPLDATLRAAREMGTVWLPTLGEIADWWRERAKSSVIVKPRNDGGWDISLDGPADAVARLGDHMIRSGATRSVHTPGKPVIAIDSSSPAEFVASAREAGFVLESYDDRTGLNGSGPTLWLSDVSRGCRTGDEVVRMLGQRSENVVRLSPWPFPYGSCLSVSGDIDALTLFDFALRLKEF